MTQPIIDIIITTRNRREYTERTITHLFARTVWPFRLHLIDDASTDDTVEYELQLWKAGLLSSLTLRRDRAGMMANKNVATWLGFSDPFVLCDDDILCPEVRPCWLTRGMEAMMERPTLGVLALFHPGANRGAYYGQDEKVVYVEAVGNTYMFVRRAVVERWSHAHFQNNYGVIDEIQRSCRAREVGMTVGVLKDTYCYHIGERSSLTPHPYTGPFIEPLDWETLTPPSRWLYQEGA